MNNNPVIYGLLGGFYVTQGYGDSSIEAPPTPPIEGIEDAILGPEEAGIFASTNKNPSLEES